MRSSNESGQQANRGSLDIPQDAQLIFGEPAIEFKANSGAWLFLSPPTKKKSQYRWNESKDLDTPWESSRGLPSKLISVARKDGQPDDQLLVAQQFTVGETVLARPIKIPQSDEPIIYQVFVIKQNSVTHTRGREQHKKLEILQSGFMYSSDLLEDKEHFKPYLKPLFKRIPIPADIRQSELADCFLLSSIGSILLQPNGPAFIENMMIHLDDGTVVVRLYDPRTLQPCYVQVRYSYLSKNNKSTVLHKHPWTHIIEKAFAGLAFKTVSDNQIKIDTASFASMYGEGGDPSVALQVLTGNRAVHVLIDCPNRNPLHFNYLDVFIDAGRFVGDEKLDDKINACKAEHNLLYQCLKNAEEKTDETIIQFINYLNKIRKDKLYEIVQSFDCVYTVIEKLNELEPFPENIKRCIQAKFPPSKVVNERTMYLNVGPLHSGEYTEDQYQLFDELKKQWESGKILTTITHKSFDDQTESEGLVNNHVYTISGVYEELNSATNKTVLRVRVRNPWNDTGRVYESSGESSSDSEEEKTSPSPRAMIKGIKQDEHAESNLDLKDFTRFFCSYQIGELPAVPKKQYSAFMKPKPKNDAKKKKSKTGRLWGALAWLLLIGLGIGIAIATCGVSLIPMCIGGGVGFMTGSAAYRVGMMKDEEVSHRDVSESRVGKAKRAHQSLTTPLLSGESDSDNDSAPDSPTHIRTLLRDASADSIASPSTDNLDSISTTITRSSTSDQTLGHSSSSSSVASDASGSDKLADTLRLVCPTISTICTTNAASAAPNENFQDSNQCKTWP